MNIETIRKIDIAKAKALASEALCREEIMELLEMPEDAEETLYLRQAAYDAAKEITGGRAYLWGAIGVDFVPCSMNCRFCSFGEEWNIIQDKVEYTDEEILAQVRDYVDAGVRFIVLRTTEFYSIQALCDKIRRIRREIPGQYELILNIGEFDLETAWQMYESGVSGIYHAVRLREGVDTPFDPTVREATMQAVKDSPLKLISLVEPVGYEHTPEELADAFLRIASYDAAIAGTMARVPVPGTPLGSEPMISEERIAQLTAVFRLAAGRKIPDICVHPGAPSTVGSGANVAVIEKGAIPRDAEFASSEWNAQTAEAEKRWFRDGGYEVLPWEQ